MSRNLILFDFNNLAHRCVHLRQVKADSLTPDYDFWHYLVFNAMYEYVLKVAADNEGPCDIVIALDSTDGYWRRDIYPPYKMDRVEKRAADDIDWQRVYQEFEKYTANVAECLPWKVLRVSQCEADDIIAVLAKDHVQHGRGQVFIHSSDQDYLMLLGEGIHVFNPMRQEYMEFPHFCKVNGKEFRYENVAEFIEYAILTGQGGKDNVFNIKTPTDFDGPRKPGFGIVAAAKLLAKPRYMEAIEEAGFAENYARNKALIDPNEIPEYWCNVIRTEFEAMPVAEADIYAFLRRYSWPSFGDGREVDFVLRTAAGLEVQEDDIEVEDTAEEYDSVDFEL